MIPQEMNIILKSLSNFSFLLQFTTSYSLVFKSEMFEKRRVHLLSEVSPSAAGNHGLYENFSVRDDVAPVKFENYAETLLIEAGIYDPVFGTI